MPGRSVNRSGQRDRTWTHGERDSTRFQTHQLATSVVTRLDDPDPLVLREYIARQACWWCEREGFKVLALHTNGAHRIDRFQLRDLAGLYYSTPVCDPGHSASCAARPQVESLKAHTPDNRRPRRLSIAAQALNRVKLQPYRTDHALQVRAAHIGGLKRSMPHPCPVCGTTIPRSKPITCGPVCRKVVRQETAKAQRQYTQCMEIECERPHCARGLCTLHYQRAKRRAAW